MQSKEFMKKQKDNLSGIAAAGYWREREREGSSMPIQKQKD